MRFIEVVLLEPEKDVVALADAHFFPPFQLALLLITKVGPIIPPKLLRRQGRLVYSKKSNETSIWVVELAEVHAVTQGDIIGAKLFHQLLFPNVQPSYGLEDDSPNHRLTEPLIFCRIERDCHMENGYARPVEGIYVLVDLQNMVVVEFEDRKLVPLLPADPLRNYTPVGTHGGVDRSDVKPKLFSPKAQASVLMGTLFSGIRSGGGSVVVTTKRKCGGAGNNNCSGDVIEVLNDAYDKHLQVYQYRDAMEYAECEAIIKEFPPFGEAMKRRCVEDMDLLMVDPCEADPPNHRLPGPLIFCRTERDCLMENGYLDQLKEYMCLLICKIWLWLNLKTVNLFPYCLQIL
ncbi:hypothetical protein Vadar_023917 [Vaccinium darrowii]|uniref:Uncharacterized protein n=1 Tax=Vaccinium darrowii TaxID=229202 RepID=A0ACB7YFR5_9ERIC|nr:hypothetical protein Vadar_023917 [Vaccinium darrowii]